MYSKVLFFVAVVAIAAALPQPGHDHHHHVVHHHETKHQETKHHEPKHEEHHHDEHVGYVSHPKYEFEYKVEDPHTKDSKFHHETRDGDSVKGVYSFHEADGRLRIVEYSADKHNGFKATVKHEGHPHHAPTHHHHH